MENQLEFEPAMSNFLDDGFSNVKGKEKRKAKKAARKEKRATKKAARQEKRAAKKGGATIATPLAEGSSSESAEREGASTEPSTTKTEGATAGASTGAGTSAGTTTTAKDSTETKDATATAGATSGGDKGGESGGGTTGGGASEGDEKKILGMKPMVAYGVFALVAIGGGLLIWQMSKGKGTPAVATA